VEWHLASEHQASEPLQEPLMLDQLVDVAESKHDALPESWARIVYFRAGLRSTIANTASAFAHDMDPRTFFTHPIHIHTKSSVQRLPNTSTYLTCSTTTATLTPATVLVGSQGEFYVVMGPSKISVFEENFFKDGPKRDKYCPVLVLQKPNGGFAGLLRLMTHDPVEKGTPLELIAISMGSATMRDMRSSFEWRIYETGSDEYHQESHGQTIEYRPAWLSQEGKVALLFDIAMAFSDNAAGGADLQSTFDEVEQRCTTARQAWVETLSQTYPEGPFSSTYDSLDWFRARNDVLGFKIDGDMFGSRRGYKKPKSAQALWNLVKRMVKDRCLAKRLEENPPSIAEIEQDERVCEFYNVLWVERKDGVSYRRACGWVPKQVWERVASGRVEVKIG
jgi:hypothetical protein